MPKKLSGGADETALLLFTELIVCERDGDIFYAGGRSRKYERTGAMTAEYVRELVGRLGALLAEYDTERGKPLRIIADAEFSNSGDDDAPILCSFIDALNIPHKVKLSRKLARKWHEFLTLNPPGNLIPFKARG